MRPRDSRREEVIKLLSECVRYPLIHLGDLTDHVLPYVLDKNDNNLLHEVIDAQTYHLRPDKHVSQYAGHRKATLRFFSDAIITLPQKGSRCLQMWQHPIEHNTPIPTAKAPEYIPSNAAIAEMDGFIYVAGGKISEVGSTLVQRYNPRNDTWFVGQPMEQGRYDFSLTALNGKLHAVGGSTKSSISTNVVEYYNVNENKWEQVKPVTGSTYRHGATVVGDKLYIAGGERGAIQCYDPVSNKWECLIEEQCLAEKHICQMCGFKGVLHILWTEDVANFDKLKISEQNVYRLSITDNMSLPSLPSENYAKN